MQTRRARSWSRRGSADVAGRRSRSMLAMSADARSVAEALRSALDELEPGIVAAWLFGSVARGAARPDSDVDVAILRASSSTPRTIADLPLDLEDDLAGRLRRRVQVVDVGNASSDLVHRVLRDGVLLIDRDRRARVEFEVASRNEYFDMTPVWRRYRAGRSA